MKIAEIELFQVDLPCSGCVHVLSGGREYTSFDASIVRISTECGIEGWGESTPFGSTYVAAHALGTRAVGAIGMPVARRPSHRSRRALLTHRAPALSFGVKASLGVRM